MSVLLLFPPTWTLTSGSPHVALPLLKAFLQNSGIDAEIWDLNWEFATSVVGHVSAKTVASASKRGRLSEMNQPYFAAEDKLQALASRYTGTWNAQYGFEFNDAPHHGSKSAFEYLQRKSPFTDWYLASVIPRIQKKAPDVLGFTIAAVQQLLPTLELCKQLRAFGYRGAVVIGGNTVTRLRKEMACPEIFAFVDGLIAFQGEIPLLRFCRAVERRESLASVPGLTWECGGKVITNAESIVLEADTTPTPDFGDLPVGRYWGQNYLCLVAARGCYYGRCSFCAIPYGWGQSGYAGCRSAAKVHEDMLLLMRRHGTNRFKFVDEALSPRFMRELSQEILKNGTKVEWEGYTRLENAWYDDQFVQLVSESGFRKGYFGLEVLPSRGRDRLNKGDHPKPEMLLRTCRRSRIKVHFFCMVGFPGTGVEDANRTIHFVLENADVVDTADVFPWTYAKHTKVLGATPILDPVKDWAIEFEHEGVAPGILSSPQVREIASVYEDVLWEAAPRLLHPTYRMVSPWTSSCSMMEHQEHSSSLVNPGEPKRIVCSSWT